MKTCSKCYKEKPTSEFNRAAHNKSGFRGDCRICQNTFRFINRDRYRKSAREWLLKNKRKKALYNKKLDLKKKYGLTIEEYSKKAEEQQHRCLMCKQQGELAVDHDHKTGKIRGLLCRPCNLIIGLAKENKDILLGGIYYLNSF